MSDVVIRAEGLGKAYQIRHEAERRHDRFSEMLTERARRLFRRAGEADPTRETFWALRDVSFEIREGEVVGIIGRNGAGKSTLLKILSRITEPTEGRVEIRGRVASLLEVGTGFHPELTGRENIFLNGAILGMSRAEIRAKFDEIVDFAGVEKFLDTPVKRYSTGMGVRLAFAVAAHLEPEILVVDEVLAVGDAGFQKKCLGKMGEVAKGGRTVLFVSHNMAAVNQLCPRALHLKCGNIARHGKTEAVIGSYLASIESAASQEIVSNDRELSSPLRSVRVNVGTSKGPGNVQGESCGPRTFESVTFSFEIASVAPVRNIGIVIRIHTHHGFLISTFSNSPESAVQFSLSPGLNRYELTIPKLALSAGHYLISAGVTIPNFEWLFYREHGILLQVREQDIFNSSRPPLLSRYPVPMEHEWRPCGSAHDIASPLAKHVG